MNSSSRAQVCGLTDIAKADVRINAFEQFAQPGSNIAGSTGDQDMHVIFLGYSTVNIIKREGRRYEDLC